MRTFVADLKEAKEHMERAGYDALEVVAGNLGTIIITKLTPYNTETLSKVQRERGELPI